jgi:cryptochrome
MSGVWFRKSLRLHDNPALVRACEAGDAVPIFILDPHFTDPDRIGVNQFSFFRQGLLDLDEQLRARGSRLIVLRGTPEQVWKEVFAGKHKFKLNRLFWERDTTPYAKQRDEAVTALAQKHRVEVQTFSRHTLLDIGALVSSPGFRAPLNNGAIERMVMACGVDAPLPVPTKIPPLKVTGYEMFTLEEIGYPTPPQHIAKGGERAGLEVLENICRDSDYVCKFDKTKTSSTTGHKGTLSTTGLSPYLMCGAVSVRMVYHKVQTVLMCRQHTKAPESLLGQLYFREMHYMLGASTANFDKQVGNVHCLQVPWSHNPEFVKAWTNGQTGYPFIDAIMRQLHEHGWIHHLARHAVSCFLTRGDLWQSWEHGRDVFGKLLIDSDPSLNNGNWLSLSGIVPWSAAFYRIYSPIPEGKTALNVEQDGAYIRRFVPELKDMPTKYIFAPWTAPKEVQQKAKCIIGKDYPAPIVDHAVVRKENLDKFKQAIDDRKAAKVQTPEKTTATATGKGKGKGKTAAVTKDSPRKKKKTA